MKRLAHLSPDIRQYLIITGNYWSFTLTDGALRMLVVLYFHALGYSPLEVAMLFLFYLFSFQCLFILCKYGWVRLKAIRPSPIKEAF